MHYANRTEAGKSSVGILFMGVALLIIIPAILGILTGNVYYACTAKMESMKRAQESNVDYRKFRAGGERPLILPEGDAPERTAVPPERDYRTDRAPLEVRERTWLEVDYDTRTLTVHRIDADVQYKVQRYGKNRKNDSGSYGFIAPGRYRLTKVRGAHGLNIGKGFSALGCTCSIEIEGAAGRTGLLIHDLADVRWKDGKAATAQDYAIAHPNSQGCIVLSVPDMKSLLDDLGLAPGDRLEADVVIKGDGRRRYDVSSIDMSEESRKLFPVGTANAPCDSGEEIVASPAQSDRPGDREDRSPDPLEGECSGAEEVNLRAGPGTENRVIGRVKKYTGLKILRVREVKDGGVWYQVRLEDGAEGWMRSDLVKLH
jgi:hypothetical protein